MCHVILVGLPLLAVLALWVLPTAFAIPTTIGLIVATLLIYRYLMKGARRPVITGVEALRHAHGLVRSVREGNITVALGSELWSAVADGALKEGDPVEVTGIVGLTLTVRKLDRSSTGSG